MGTPQSAVLQCHLTPQRRTDMYILCVLCALQSLQKRDTLANVLAGDIRAKKRHGAQWLPPRPYASCSSPWLQALHFVTADLPWCALALLTHCRQASAARIPSACCFVAEECTSFATLSRVDSRKVCSYLYAACPLRQSSALEEACCLCVVRACRFPRTCYSSSW